MMKKTGIYFFVVSYIMLSKSAYGDASCFPLQAGNSWTYYRGYKLPETCATGFGFECILEGTETTSRIERSDLVNGKEYFIMATRIGNDTSAIHRDTLRSEGEIIYKYSNGNDIKWLDLSDNTLQYKYDAPPSDSFGVKYFNNSIVVAPEYLPVYTLSCRTITDTVFVLKGRRYGTFRRVEYFDTTNQKKLVWSENYWPGIGLVYAEESYERYSGYTRHLVSAIINGDSVSIRIEPQMHLSAIGKKTVASDSRFYDLQGRRIYSMENMTNFRGPFSGICVCKKKTFYVLKASH